MSDACICLMDDDPGPSLHREALPTARKPHRCGECRRKIQRGERYERVSGVWEGGWSTFKTCLDCRSVRDELFDCGFVYEQLWIDVEELLEDVSVASLDAMTLRGRERVCRILGVWDDGAR